MASISATLQEADEGAILFWRTLALASAYAYSRVQNCDW